MRDFNSIRDIIVDEPPQTVVTSPIIDLECKNEQELKSYLISFQPYLRKNNCENFHKIGRYRRN